MDKGVKESIEKFENKKEFREVKLKTSKSFREDKQALDDRISKYRNKPNTRDGSVEDITKDKDVNGELTSERKENGLEAMDKPAINGNGEEKVVTPGDVKLTVTEGKASNGTVGNGHANGQAGQTLQANANTNGVVGLPSNGVILNGHGHKIVKASAVMNGYPDGSRTPEPRPKSGRRIYEKNPKLSNTSTDHLDTISLRGSKSGNHIQQQKIVSKPLVPQHTLPAIPAAEVTSIPADGNLNEFSVQHMVTIFRLLHLPDELIYRLNRGKVDGKRFSMFTDKELSDLGMNNPLIKYFRDRSGMVYKTKRKQKFML